MMQKALAIKCAIIFLIGLGLLIPLTMISGKINERRDFQFDARTRISQSWTGEQTLITPVLVLPYLVEITHYSGKDRDDKPIEKTSLEWRKRYIVPDVVDVNAKVETQLRKQGLYGIPVYSASFSMNGRIDADHIAEILDQLTQLTGFQRFGVAFLSINLADIRGIDGSPSLSWQDQTQSFLSNSGIETLESGIHAPLPELTAAGDKVFSLQLAVRGMESLKLVPAAKHFHLTLSSPWPHPQFVGAFLPVSHDISAQGFEANWQVNHFSTGIEQLIRQCETQNCFDLQSIAFGVNFIEAVDAYLQAERSLKYGILFIGLSFIAFFMFETLRHIPIHPVQYTLVGFALAVFFLLLTSLSEHMSFALAYFIATSACVSLLAYYLRFVLGAWKEASIFTISISALYGLLFVIVGAEDFALLMGSGLIFVVLAAIMLMTRNIDWYKLRETAK